MFGQDSFDLLSDLAALSIESAAPRDSGLVEATQMEWSRECRLGLEFKNLYQSRMALLGRFSINGIAPVSQVSQNNVQYCIAGVLKRIEARRVRAFEKEYQQKYCGDSIIYSEHDELEIEDESGKLKLRFVDCTMGQRKLKATDVPYGVVVALEGRFKKDSNRFAVRRLFLPELPPQPTFRPNHPSLRGKQLLVLSEPTIQQVQNVAQQLSFCYSEELRAITGVVIMGGVEMRVESIRAMAEAVEQLKESVDVFLMPSSSPDRRRMFPLQPYSANFFPHSHQRIALCSNPQELTAENGLKMHLSCGENVVDFMRNCSMAADELQVLEQMVNFAHCCPTSPFSLRTEPYLTDHLVFSTLPHILLAGKARFFASKMLQVEGKEVLLVAVPAGGMGLLSLQGGNARSFN